MASNSKQIKDEIRKDKISRATHTTNFGTLLEDTICRVAYPSYRVFIFGQEVTEDVIAVRLSQSGGSAERSAGSCMITLLNKADKYIYTHDDMLKIAKLKSRIAATNKATKAEGPKYSVTLDIAGVPRTVEDLRELAKKLKNADAEETSYWLQGLFGDIAEDRASADALARQIIKFVDEEKLGLRNEYETLIDYESEFLGKSGQYDIKNQIVNKKINEYTPVPDPKKINPSVSNVNNPNTFITYDFPMYEGDCIFNPNDPVRVFFRDPFDPLVWYYMFAGFVDSFTEDFSEDQESIISLTCTDVSKILRYSVAQTNLGSSGQSGISRDERIADRIKELYGFTNIDNYISDVGIYHTAKLFDSLTVLEILEILFFGEDSATNVIEKKYTKNVADEYSSKVIEELRASYSTTDSKGNKQEPTLANIYEYLKNVLNLDISIAKEIVTDYSGILDAKSQTGWENDLRSVIGPNVKKMKLATLGTFNFPALTFPGDVTMKRKTPDLLGVSFYVIGKPDIIDKTLGAKEIKSLKEWNDLIHHRVKRSDLEDMFNPVDKSRQATTRKISKPKFQEVQDIITTIGTNIDDYPVGGGRLFYLTYSEIEQATERSVLDRSVGGPGSDLHSSYIDRLTLLYDLAKNIDFRFYATPRGDFVFELPFYDFDPNMFWDKPNSVNVSKKLASFIDNYEAVFTESYSGNYTEDDTYKTLTGLQFLINAETGMLENPLQGYEGDDYYDYEAVFSIGNEDMISFSNTLNDQGLITVAIAKPNTIGLRNDVDGSKQLAIYQNAYAAELIQRLGVRVATDDTWNAVSTPEAAKMSANLMLNSTNSNCRNCGIRIIPRFGMMVNRPVWWRYRNQYGNILSVDHSINWSSDVSTSVNVNNVRAWNGSIDSDGNYIHQRFGGETAFNWKDLVLRSGAFGNRTGSEKDTNKNDQPVSDAELSESVDYDNLA